MAGEGARGRRLAGSITCVTYTAAGTGDSREPGPPPGAGIVIAVDGPSGSGKSSAARGVARALGLRYLDTGAMYRAMTWWMLEQGVDITDVGSVIERAGKVPVEIGTDPDQQLVRAGGADVTAAIRTRRVSNAVSAVASVGEVRTVLIALQRDLIEREARTGPGIVAEGRDIGTVVVPAAAVKIYLTASEQARAERRAAELAGLAAGEAPGADVTRAEQARRDRKDAPQSRPAADAVEIDATDLTLEEVIGKIVDLAVLARKGRSGTAEPGAGGVSAPGLRQAGLAS